MCEFLVIRTSFPGCFTTTRGCFLTSGISNSINAGDEAQEVHLSRPFLVEEQMASTARARAPVSEQEGLGLFL